MCPLNSFEAHSRSSSGLSFSCAAWTSQMHLHFPQIKTGIFVDDRTIWLQNDTVANLKKAVQHSVTLDLKLGFVNNTDIEVFSSNESWIRQRLKQLGTVHSWFCLLGIQYQQIFFDTSHVTSLIKHINLVLSRIRFLFRSGNLCQIPEYSETLLGGCMDSSIPNSLAGPCNEN